MRRLREVRKRDNRVAPFDRNKISDAIYRALRSVGEGDRSLADELALAVEHFLGERAGRASAGAADIPGIEDIQDVVETVLMEMGYSKVAKAYILYRQKRAMLRDTLEVRREPESRPDGIGFAPAGAADLALPGARLPEVDENDRGTSSWQKSRITAALVREADLDPTLAEDVATRVEERVLKSGMRRISTGLIRELVDNELFERGFDTKLRRQAPIGLPKYNLEQVLFASDSKEGFAFPKSPSEVHELVASRILSEYSLQEVYSPPVSQAHREGRIFLHDLADPLRLQRAAWAMPLAAPGSPGVVDAFFLRLASLERFISEEVRCLELPRLLRALDPSRRGESAVENVSALVGSVFERWTRQEGESFRTGPRKAIEIDLDERAEPWLRGLLDVARTGGDRVLLGLRLHPEFARARRELRRLLAELARSGIPLELLPADAARERALEGGPAGEGLSLVGGKVTVNLPRAAYRSARVQGRTVEGELDAAVELAVKGLLERRHFLTRLAAHRENPLWGLVAGGDGRVAARRLDELSRYTVGVVGLNECVKFLTGRELHQEGESRRRGRQLVERLARAVRREGERLGIRLVLEETVNTGRVRQLEALDRKAYGFEECAYTDGVRWHRHAPIDPLRRLEELTALSPHIACAGGVVEELPELAGAGGELLLSLLDTGLRSLVPEPEAMERAV